MTNKSTLFSITDESNGSFSYEKLPFDRIKKDILPDPYELSLVFVSNEKSRELNAQYRNKDYPTNILSFPLEETSGEIFIALDKAQEEAPLYNRDLPHFVLYLFIHGAFHLKGMEHGIEMERAEAEIREKYGV